MSRILLSLLATAALAGCATHLVPLDQTTAVPAERTFAAEYTTPAEGRQKITVVRDAGAMYGAAIKWGLWVDGKKVARLATSEAVVIYLPPGEHLLTTAVSDIDSNPNVAVVVNIPTRFVVYRIDMADSRPKLQPSIE